ncbi:protein translocase subunit SecF [Bdellovibrio sp. HCB290]|uniref:protein translocase subunit SecF n=1 Tax=Bdellovibrio sp. HCB290 TaxID=3394356 RepID=UPI0039B66F9C
MANNNSKTATTESWGKIDFVGKTNLFTGISVLLVVLSLAYLAIKGVNYGIDFKGGTEFQVKFAQGVTIDQVRESVDELQLGDVGVQAIGENNEFIIRFQGKQGATDKETNEILNQDIGKIRTMIETKFANHSPDIRRVDTVGPQVGAELKRNGLLAVFYCLLVILIYVGLRFDYKYAPGAVFCLFHDAVITLAIFVAVGKEVNVPILAAILTLIGYSLNDTIVVFDRIRETDGIYHDKGYKFIINKAINDMLRRTFMTSGTVFTSALCLWIFSGGTVGDIAFAICVGIAFGTYSSIYVAAPFVMYMDKLMGKKAA